MCWCVNQMVSKGRWKCWDWHSDKFFVRCGKLWGKQISMQVWDARSNRVMVPQIWCRIATNEEFQLSSGRDPLHVKTFQEAGNEDAASETLSFPLFDRIRQLVWSSNTGRSTLSTKCVGMEDSQRTDPDHLKQNDMRNSSKNKGPISHQMQVCIQEFWSKWGPEVLQGTH